jgi:hypothetical protein
MEKEDSEQQKKEMDEKKGGWRKRKRWGKGRDGGEGNGEYYEAEGEEMKSKQILLPCMSAGGERDRARPGEK